MRSAEFEIEMFPAENGDAFLVTARDADQCTRILIDGGTAATFESQLRGRLQEIASDGGCLDLLVVTHIDSDHIGGVLRLIEHNGKANSPSLIEIKDIWHNSYRHLPQPDDSREPTNDEVGRVEAQVAPAPTAPRKAISARDGTMLAGLLRRNGYTWNGAFSGEGVVTRPKTAPITLNGSVEITLLSPTPKALEKLARKWRADLMKMGVDRSASRGEAFEEVFERLLLGENEPPPVERANVSAGAWPASALSKQFVEDTSVSNASSIAFRIAFGGYRCLFLGDALPSQIREALEEQVFDVVKVSHHGSKRSTSIALLEQIKAKTFLISTDGVKHPHPDEETLARIVSTQPACRILFNYSTGVAESLVRWNEETSAGFEIRVGDGQSTTTFVLPE